MKRNRVLSVLAASAAALLPLAAICQVDSSRAAEAEATHKYGVMVGYGYTSLNQVNNSRYGLQGVNIAVLRDYAKYFALTVDGAYFKYSVVPCNTSDPSATCNPGDPIVYQLLAGPEVHAPIYGRVSGFVRGLIGVAHTGGENMNPATSFAGGFGIGMQYQIRPRLAIRASGDDILASFSLRNATTENAYSPHLTRNARAGLGVVYRF